MVSYTERPWTKNYDPSVPKSLEPYPDKTVFDLLREAAQKAPDSTVLITDAKLPFLGHQSRNVTYSEMDRWSDELASGLLDMGLKKGARVALVLPNCVAFAIGYYAVLKAGGVVAAMNPTYPPAKMQQQVVDSSSEIAITLSRFYEVVKQIQPQTKIKNVIVTNIKEYFPGLAKFLFTLAREKKEGHRVEKVEPGDFWLQDILARYSGKKPNVQVDPSSVALFQYTGGTTGVSKGAMLTHRNLVANMLQIQAWSPPEAFGNMERSDAVYLGAIPMFHVYGLVVMLSQAVASGAKIVLVPNPRDVDYLVDIIHTYQPNVFLGVPAMYNSVVNHPRVKSGEVRMDSFVLSSSGAAPLPPATKREFEAAGAHKLHEGYGMSECSAASHANPLMGENKVGSVGMPLPDMDVRIVSLDDGETEVPVGEIGEIVMSGPNVMLGYHGMPTETANTIREKDGKRWLYSGDIGRMDEDGYFYIVDRKKDMALIGGFNVYPNNVEKVIKDHPAVLEVGVAAVPHPEHEGQEALKAWIVLQAGVSITEQELIDHCSTYLAQYEVPRRYAFVAELPKTTVGKTLRRELVQMELDEREKTLQ
jgi:long-chain acyl-CoA synthetase